MDILEALTETLTTSAYNGCGGRIVVVGVGRVEGIAQGVYDLALETGSYVGVDANVGVAEKFL